MAPDIIGSNLCLGEIAAAHNALKARYRNPKRRILYRAFHFDCDDALSDRPA
ncbi:hypothetical protein MKSMC1_24780 [Mycobacterium kansasii]|nr:hypothetical protein MKSMC1_24780 [Mycobacterium kansasii]